MNQSETHLITISTKAGDVPISTGSVLTEKGMMRVATARFTYRGRIHSVTTDIVGERFPFVKLTALVDAAVWFADVLEETCPMGPGKQTF